MLIWSGHWMPQSEGTWLTAACSWVGGCMCGNLKWLPVCYLTDSKSHHRSHGRPQIWGILASFMQQQQEVETRTVKSWNRFVFCFSKQRCLSGKVRKQSDSWLCYWSVIGAWTKLGCPLQTVGKTLNIRTGVSHTCGWQEAVRSCGGKKRRGVDERT